MWNIILEEFDYLSDFVVDQSSWTAWSKKVDKRPDKKFRQAFTGTLAAKWGSKKRLTGSLACSQGGRGGGLGEAWTSPLYGWAEEWIQGSGWRDGLGGLPTLLVVLCAQCMHSTLNLLPAPQKYHLGFWSFYILFIICPHLCMHAVIFNPL